LANISGWARSRIFAAAAKPGSLFLLLFFVSLRAFGGVVTLAWDVESAPVVGYMIYYGPTAGSYSSKIDVGNKTSYTVSGLAEGATYHFAATAYDAAHTESGFSNDAVAVVPYGTPVAQFSASTTAGPAPLSLNFLNASTGSITSYAWDFGDGTTSTGQAPIHVYGAAGVFTVKLTVTGPGGSNTQTRSNYLTVTTPPSAPVAQFTGSPTSGVAPLAASFANSSTGSITSYAWDFGDGATSTLANPSHSYAAAGVYTVKLNVTGPGGSNTQTRSNYLTVTTSSAPVAQFIGRPSSGVAPLAVSFVNTSTGSMTSYAWDFGDGATSTAASPSHSYAVAGVYTVTLKVTGPGGSNMMTRTDYVSVSSAKKGKCSRNRNC
jgi:PKD repeat protein